MTTEAVRCPSHRALRRFRASSPAMNQKLGERIAAGFPVEGRDVVELLQDRETSRW